MKPSSTYSEGTVFSRPSDVPMKPGLYCVPATRPEHGYRLHTNRKTIIKAPKTKTADDKTVMQTLSQRSVGWGITLAEKVQNIYEKNIYKYFNGNSVKRPAVMCFFRSFYFLSDTYKYITAPTQRKAKTN